MHPRLYTFIVYIIIVNFTFKLFKINIISTCYCNVIQVDLAWDMGHKRGAREASNHAKYWAIGAIATGGIIVGIWIILIIIGASGGISPPSTV